KKAIEESGCEFINISLGPDLPIQDDTVNAWTIGLDQLAFERQVFITVAAGNNGQADPKSGAARIEAPADGVNAVTIGAADRTGSDWARAPYSAIGPGRSPALIKPDFTAFGGSEEEYFRVLTPGASIVVGNQMGTSFASPYFLRSAVALRVWGGSRLTRLTIKALLVHGAERGDRDSKEVGWGRVPVFNPLDPIPKDRPWIYQGQMTSGNFVRIELPWPNSDLGDTVSLKATFCYLPPVASHDPLTYTQAALYIRFVPDLSAPVNSQGHPPSHPFFDLDGGELNQDQDAEAILWAPVKSNQNAFPKEFLKAPGFEIRYVDRSLADGEGPPPVDYSLVVTAT
ncbi:MAG: S8 family serine peptidase, partial [Deltaproteobacteria bacterium]|nr:S8 family serine peptidase [Deltaproteobacteria bacterium]